MQPISEEYNWNPRMFINWNILELVCTSFMKQYGTERSVSKSRLVGILSVYRTTILLRPSWLILNPHSVSQQVRRIMEGNRRMGMVWCLIVLFLHSDIIIIVMLHTYAHFPAFFLVQVVIDSSTGSVVDYACEVEITE